MRRRLLSMVCILLLCAFHMPFPALAIEATDSSESDGGSSVYSRLKPLDSAVTRQPISCFDVNEDGWIVLGFEPSTDKYICVYDQTGSFQYGYSFEDYGTISVGWNGDDLDILLNRGGLLMTIDGQTKNLTTIDTDSLPIDRRAYENSMRPFESIQIGDKTYHLERGLGPLGIFVSGYARLTVTDQNGVRQMIYDATEAYTGRAVIMAVLISGFCIYGIVMLLPYFRMILLRFRKRK